jgi:hypothetical protein
MAPLWPRFYGPTMRVIVAASPGVEPISVPSVRFTGALGGGGDVAPVGDVNGDGHDSVRTKGDPA